LLRRQLPEVSTRLRQTLDKLVGPGKTTPAEPVPAAEWLASLESRYAVGSTTVIGKGDLTACPLTEPVLFSSAAENLLQNIAAKQRRQPGLKAVVRLICIHGEARLEVSDDGSAIPESIAAKLLIERVASEDGLGIGLYQCARQAEQAGYRLELAKNIDGCVRFRLARAD
jgi:signal transduction histidine kinase